MRTQIPVSAKFELYIPELDNHLLIETGAAGVVIRATRDNFSARRKTFFIRHLAAEGYIPDQYEWFAESSGDGFLGVKWMIGASSKASEGRFRSIRRWCTRRNAIYSCLALVWLISFFWAVGHTSHGL